MALRPAQLGFQAHLAVRPMAKKIGYLELLALDDSAGNSIELEA
jgi:hypothetical protein